MIEIDDRVVMLLFILFLGYMLFNTREGFNVGGQNLDYNGKCDCLDKSDTGCINEGICSKSSSKGVCDRESRCKWTSIMDHLDQISGQIIQLNNDITTKNNTVINYIRSYCR